MADKNAEFNNSGQGQLRVPGYGLPLNYWPGIEVITKWSSDLGDQFRHGVADYAAQRLTVKELAMLRFMNAITDKPSWDQKLLDEQIVSKWRSETNDDFLMTDAAFNWCIQELRDKVQSYRELKYVTTFNNDTVFVKSDILIDETARLKLKEVVRPLLEIEAPLKDWHPNSNEQVLNLVHPSMFPLVYGKSRVLPSGIVDLDDCLNFIGKGEKLSTPEVKDYNVNQYDAGAQLVGIQFWSLNFQWLPCEVRFQGTTGVDVKITSYVNNLHPARHKELYSIIEGFISASIKPWNEVLIRGTEGRHPPRIYTLGAETKETIGLPDWVERLDTGIAADDFAKHINAAREFINLPNHPTALIGEDVQAEILREFQYINRNSYYGDLVDIVENKERLTREVIHPDPGESSTYEQWKNGNGPKAVISSCDSDKDFHRGDYDNYTINLEEEFRQAGLQVIVKLASIELTPEKPDYPGGNWHLEGMLNEHIVATSIYYYDVDNTTVSSIRFRQQAELDVGSLDYEQDQHQHLCSIFGTKSFNDEQAVQEIGNIDTPQGRLIAFSNVSQHRVEPFSLIDRSRPGHRRFLLLWLVDPYFRIMSTANVPPQQQDWWASEYLKVAGGRLPSEINQMIVDNNSNELMQRSEAEEVRLKLMAERTDFGNRVEQSMGSYNLCEH